MLFLEQNLANCSLVKEEALSETIVSWTPWVANMWCRSSIVDSHEAVWVIATLTHSEIAFTKYGGGGQVTWFLTHNEIEPFFQDQHGCFATKPNYGPVPSLKWFLGGCYVIISWPVHALLVGLVTLQPHRMHPSSTLSSSFLLKNGNTSAVHVLSCPHQNTVFNLGHHWVSASSFLYLLGKTFPLSVFSVRFSMSSGMGVSFGALASTSGTQLRPFAWPFSLCWICV